MSMANTEGMDENTNAVNDIARTIDEATAAINRFIAAYTEYEKRQAIDRSIGGLRVIAEQWLAARKLENS